MNFKKTFDEKVTIIFMNLFSLLFLGISLTILLNFNKLIFLFTDFHSVDKTFIENLPKNINYNYLEGTWYGMYNNNYNNCFRTNILKNNNLLYFNFTNQLQENYSKKFKILNNSSILKNLNNMRKELIKEDYVYIFYLNSNNLKNSSKYDFFATLTPRDIYFTINYDIQVYSRNPNINFKLQKNIVKQVENFLSKYLNYNRELVKINYDNYNCENLIYNNFIDVNINNFKLNKMYGDWFVILYGSSSGEKLRAFNNTCKYIKINITEKLINKKCLSSLKTNSYGNYINYQYEDTSFHEIISINERYSKSGKFLLNKNKNYDAKIILNNQMINRYDNISRYQILDYYTLSKEKEYEYLMLLISNNISNTVMFLSRMPLMNKNVLYNYLDFLNNNRIIKEYIFNTFSIDYY